MDENSLVVEGELAVSGPPVQGSDPGAAPADDPPLQPFTLIATCTE